MKTFYYIYIYIYIYAFSRRFYPKRLTVHSGYTFFFYQYVCSLGIEPMTFCAANAMLYHWATGTLALYNLQVCDALSNVTQQQQQKRLYFKT